MSVLLLLLSAIFGAINWFAIGVSLRNKRLGIRRHMSPIPLFAQVFGIAAFVTSTVEQSSFLPRWIYVIVPLLDISLWSLAYWPVYVARQRMKDRRR
jgi:uncharacterized membrane protein YuzA (DUF378 family)